MFYKRRKQQRELVERERNGESFWSREPGVETHNRIAMILFEHVPRGDFEAAHNSILMEEGAANIGRSDSVVDRILEYSRSDPENLATAVEAILTHRNESQWISGGTMAPELASLINDVFAADRVSWEIDENLQMREHASRALHTNVLEPTLSLLRSRGAQWRNTELSFQEALGELAAKKPADAITDAGTALQECLQTLGCEGNALGPLIADAKKRGLFGRSDSKLTSALEQLAQWISANRSQRGDSHNVVAGVSLADGWLMVHIVGAVISRLADDEETR